MADDSTPSNPDSNHSPEPEKTGVTPESQTASTQIAVLPAVGSGEQRTGLSGTNVLTSAVAVLLNQGGHQLSEVVQIFTSDYERRFDAANATNQRLQEELRDEKVAHARTEERLKTVLERDRRSAFITVIGGAFFGLGISEFSQTQGQIFFCIGLVLIAVGCWPLRPRWKA